MAALFEGAEDRHQDGLAVGPALAAVAVAVFADDHRRADRPLGRVVVERNIGLIEEREQVVLMTPQAFDKRLAWRSFQGVSISSAKRLSADRDARHSVLGDISPRRRHKRMASPSSRRSFLANAGQCFARRLVLLGMFQLAQQVHQARLPQRADDRVVRSPKIGDQRSREFLDEKLRQRRRAARTVDHVVRQIWCREAPQPVRFAVHPPTAFVGVKHRRLQGFLLNLLVPGVKNRLQPIPHLHQPAGVIFICRWKLKTSTICESVLPRA